MSDEEHTVLESGSRKRPAEDDSFSFEFDGDGFKRPALASPGREKGILFCKKCRELYFQTRALTRLYQW
jgi:hypothetical protein